MRRKDDEGRHSTVDSMARLLGGGSLALGIWGVLRPSSLGRMLGVEPETARLVGFRDLGSAVLLLTDRGRLPLLSRALFDLGDAWTFRHRPLIAAGAALAAVAGLAAAAARPR